MGRILAIDPGEARVGLAVSDPLHMTAQGLPTFLHASKSGWFDHLGDLIRTWEVERILIGDPLHLDGRISPGSKKSRTWKLEIEGRWDVAVVLVDERLTSVEAERVLREAGGKRGDKGRIDRMAAVLLLQTYLDRESAIRLGEGPGA